MDDFLGDNWEAFQEKMGMLGYTEAQVDAMSEKLSVFLADQRIV